MNKNKNLKKKFEKFLDMTWEGSHGRYEAEEACEDMNYIPWTDSEGNELTKEEIMFGEKDTMPPDGIEVYGGDEPQFYDVESPGVKYIYDSKVGNFPIALETREGKLMYYKFSKINGELLPYHAGAVPKISVGMKGVPNSGKSVYYYQLIDEAFHNEIARDTNVGFSCDLPLKNSQYEKDERICEEFKKGVLPEPNRRGQTLNPYSFLVTRGNGWVQKNLMLEVTDIDGQECLENVSWENKKYCYNYFFLMIGADDILAAEKGNPLQAKKMVDELGARLNVFRDQQDFEVLVILTKADLLKDTTCLSDVFENSVSVENGAIKQVTHRRGFNVDIFNNKSRCLRKYVKNVAPVFYQKLAQTVPENCLKFAMIASVGTDCKETYDTEKYAPLNIDEPILYVLAKNGMYPAVKTNADSKKNQASGKRSKERRVFFNWILEISGLSGDSDDEDENQEEDQDKTDEEHAEKKSRYKVYRGE